MHTRTWETYCHVRVKTTFCHRSTPHSSKLQLENSYFHGYRVNELDVIMFPSVSYYGIKGYGLGLLSIPIIHTFSYKAWLSQGNRTIGQWGELSTKEPSCCSASSTSSLICEQWLDPAKKQITTACKPHIPHLLQSVTDLLKALMDSDPQARGLPG
jgi:hypothetical protein